MHSHTETVATLLDLNNEDALLGTALKRGLEKKFYRLRSNAWKVTAEIPFCGYVGGQGLTVSVEIINESNVKVEKVFVELKRLCHFKSTESYSYVL